MDNAREFVARELAFLYYTARRMENSNYCNHTTIEEYIDSSWNQFAQSAEEIIDIIELYRPEA